MKSLLVIVLLSLLSNSTVKSDDLLGLWLDESRKLIVETYKVDNLYFAKIRWFDNENKRIEKFSDKGLPKSKWLNYKVMEHFKFDGDKWKDGVIHQIKTGHTYDATIQMKNKNFIVVRGYVLISMLGENVSFTRYTSVLPKQE
jgi:uncharacterized protein (DUF2147 family)